jgi:hypothetical protein
VAGSLRRTQASLRDELDRVVQRIAQLRKKEATSEDALYEEVASAIFGEHPLYYARYKSLAEFVRAVIPGTTVRTVQRDALIAVCFDPDTIAHTPKALLEQVALYARDVSGAEEQPHPIDVKRLFVRVGTERKRALECSLPDLKRARAALAKERGIKRRAPMHPRVAVLVDAFAKKKHKAVGKVRFSGNASTFSAVAIPWEGKDAFAKVLLGVRVPKE